MADVAYCMKCREKREFTGSLVTLKNGRPALQGSCPVCGTKLTKIMGMDAAKAIAAWQHAIALQPRDYDTLFNLGVVLAEKPERADALPYLRRFVAEAPRDRYGHDLARAAALIDRIEQHRDR